MPDRFDNFTEQARMVLQFAQEEAQGFNHNYIGTEHLLLGLIRVREGTAAHVVTQLGHRALRRSWNSPRPLLANSTTTPSAPSTCSWACCARGRVSRPGFTSMVLWALNHVELTPRTRWCP